MAQSNHCIIILVLCRFAKVGRETPSGITDGSGREAVPVASLLDQMPATALQALYHAVTGKTENYSRALHGNVVISHNSVEQLYDRISQQMEHYQTLAEPTVTIIVKTKDHRQLQYSSMGKISWLFRQFFRHYL